MYMYMCVTHVLSACHTDVFIKLLLSNICVHTSSTPPQPNCYSKVITVDGQKKIMIFALRRSVAGSGILMGLM